MACWKKAPMPICCARRSAFPRARSHACTEIDGKGAAFLERPIERFNGEIKRCVEVVGIFPNEAVITRLIGAIPLHDLGIRHPLGR